MPNQDNEKFLAKVIEAFDAWQRQRRLEKGFEDIKASGDRPDGVVNNFLLDSAFVMMKKGFSIGDREKESARKLLEDSDFRAALGPLDKGTDRTEFVRQVVPNLMDIAESGRFSLRRDADMFGMIAEELWEESER